MKQSVAVFFAPVPLALALFASGVFSAAAQTATPGSCPALTLNLYRNLNDAATGGQVSALQRFLAAQGYYQPVTGYFGPLTFTNVAHFQQGRGIVSTGGVGPLTRAAIQQLCGGTVVGGLTVTSPAQGQVAQTGATLPVSWSYPVTPGSASMVIDLYTAAGVKVGTVAVNNDTIGTYNWNVPVGGQICTLQYPNGLCGAALFGQYYLQVSAVSAGNGLNPNAPIIASGRSGIFTITQASSTPPPSGAAFKDDLISVSSPLPLTVVGSSLTVTGRARGPWYFEAQFPVKLYDGLGHLLAQAPAQASGTWMTSDYVPFTATLAFTAPTTTTTGVLVLEKDNPSGLPQNADELDFPVLFRPFQ